jgi:hypothetical protein
MRAIQTFNWLVISQIVARRGALRRPREQDNTDLVIGSGGIEGFGDP